MIMIYITLGIWTGWLIPHLIANNSASVDIMLTIWWIIFLTEFESEWTYVMNIVMLFLMLASETMTTDLELLEV